MSAFFEWAWEPHHACAVVGAALALGMLLWGIGRELQEYDEERRR